MYVQILQVSQAVAEESRGIQRNVEASRGSLQLDLAARVATINGEKYMKYFANCSKIERYESRCKDAHVSVKSGELVELKVHTAV